MLFRISLESAARRRLEVTLEVPQAELPVPPDRPAAGVGAPVPSAGPESRARPFGPRRTCVLFLPVWTPGSYLVREYSRHVLGLRATDANGVERPVAKVAKNRWAVDVEGLDGDLHVRWSVYAHELTVRTAYVTSDHAYWNGACALLWPLGAEARAADFRVELPDGWRLFAGSAEVVHEDRTARFRCADLDVAVDTPCLAGPLEAQVFELHGREHRFVAAGLAGIALPGRFAADLRQVVATTAEVFGGPLPYPRYTFLSLFGSSGRGGLEHGDSSTLLAPRTTFEPRTAYEDFLALVAHEFLHVWNVKRMRPREFWEFDYESENHTRLLWVAEGFTAYFDDLLVRRAGLSAPAAYLERLASHVRNLRANPGRLVQSLGDASFDAWILLYRPDENTRNATQNYYTNGALAAFALDAEIRRASGGARSLDHALRALWTSTYEQGRGYGFEDVVRCIDEAAGRALGDLVHALAEEPFDPDLDRALELFGLRIEDREPHRAFLGLRFDNGATTVASVEDGSPAWDAGLCPADELLAVDDLRVTGATWQGVWDHVARPGTAVRLLVSRHGVVRTIEATPAAGDRAAPRIVGIERPTESQLGHRESWLGVREL